MLLRMLVGIGVALLVAWVALVLAMVVARPKGQLLKEALRLLPDVLRLLRRLAADRSLPGGVRVRLWLLLGYLAIPVDLVPDFVPVLGYADDATSSPGCCARWCAGPAQTRYGGTGQAAKTGWMRSGAYAGLGPLALTGDPCA